MTWLTAKLGDLAEVITKGTTPRTLGKGYVNSGIPFLRAENLQGDEIVLDKSTLFIDEETDKILARSRIYPGDILLSIAGTIGRAAIVTENSPQMNCNQAVAIIRIIRHINRKFLLYWFKTAQAQSQMYGAKVTLTISNLSLGQIKQLQVPLPPLSEQRRIVEILEQADALLKKRAEADVKAERILPALFIKMFGDPVTNPMGWKQTRLGDVAVDFRYGTSVKCHSEVQGLPVLRIPNILGGEIDLSDLKYGELSDEEINRLLLKEGDLLFVRTNGNPDYVGRCAVFNLNDSYLFASYLIRTRLNQEKVIPQFVATYLQTPSGRQTMSPFIRTTAGQSNISVEGLKQIPIFLPNLELQRNFVAQVGNLYKLRRQRENSKSLLEAVFQLLLNRAFPGELTAKWREAHMKELLAEMEEQTKALQAVSSIKYKELPLLEEQ